jgi:hypothetical protein
LKNLIASIIWLLFSFGLFAQIPDYSLIVKKSSEAIKIDGLLEETAWLVADKTSAFTQNFPTDSLKATSQTEIRATFDDEFLYFSGICYENSNKEHIIQSLKRDFNWPQNENLSIYFDPFNDLTNGFTFGITPAGVQREGLVTNGQDVSSDWDNKWYSAVKDFGDKWQFEMAIPFKTIRYDESITEWNIKFLRLDLKNNERSTWVPVPQQYRPSNFAFSGKLIFVDPLKKSGTNISLIPFVTSNVSKDHENNIPNKIKSDIGFDAKIGVSSSLNLDLTVNPDFSQVEVDQQVTDLNQFEIFFPEKRQFFLENSDLFAQNGFRSSRPFFSRRIGIANREDENGDNETSLIPISFGARLSGKMGQNWRLGLMNMQTAKSEKFGLPKQNYAVAVVQRQMFKRSNISFLVVNKQSLNINLQDTSSFKIDDSILKESINGADTSLYINKYNRVIGIDHNFRSFDNKWTANAYFHKSYSPNVTTKNSSFGFFLKREVRLYELIIGFSSIEENYDAEVGFVPRKDIISFFHNASYKIYPKSNIINRHGPRYSIRNRTDQSYNNTDQSYEIGYNIQFLNNTSLEVEMKHNFIQLRGDFQPDDYGPNFLEGEEHSWNEARINYRGNSRNSFSFNARGQYGGYFSGKRLQLGGSLRFRKQPVFNIAMDFSYNNIEWQKPFESAKFWLVGPKIEFTFTDKLFLTNFIQWNDQNDNLNINSRFQWRFKSASDLFLVYTDNYFPESLNVKNRSLVFKLSYWLNL